MDEKIELKTLNGHPLADMQAREELVKKQPVGNYLTEHQKLKTVNGQSLVGEGNIEIAGSGGAVTNVLAGKTFICIGDSFVKGHTLSESQTWAYKLANRNGMTYHKHAVNGVSLTKASGQSAAALITTVDSFIAGISKTDYVIFLAGHNDANPDLNGGAAVPIGENTDKVNTTFKGALNLLISKLYAAYPTAKLLFLTPFNRRGIEEPYVEAMKEVCGIWCVPCFDNYHSGGICFQNLSQAAKYELNGTLHLNEAGQERVSHLYQSLLANELPIPYVLDGQEKTSEPIDLSNYVTKDKVPFSFARMTKEAFNSLSTKGASTVYLVDGYGVFVGTTCIISTENQNAGGDESDEPEDGGTTSNFTPFTDVSWQNFNTNRAGCYPTLAIGDKIDFKESSLWDIYKYAIGLGSGGGASTTWIDGGYQSGAYTVTTSGAHTIMVARQDNADISSDEMTSIAAIIGRFK